MKYRTRKKRFLKKWRRAGITRVGKGVNLYYLDRTLTYMQNELTRRIGEALDQALLYGDQRHD